jgi:radical SAM protein with 4Fe4S-binding SPASM domain
MTHRCNLRCVHCYLGDERNAESQARELDTAFWCSVVDQIAEAGCLNLLITGGEPFARSDFAEVYTRAKRRGLLVTVFTNGTRLDDSLLRLFSELPPWLVEVSLYGATKETYDKVTTVPGAWERCLAGVDALCSAGVRVALKTVILKGNQHEVGAMRQMAEDRRANFRVDPAVFPCRDGDQGPIEHRVAAAQAVAIEMADLGHLESTAKAYERLRTLPSVDRLYTCAAGQTGFHIDPEGTLQPCMMVNGHGFDLRRGSFRTGWDDVIRRFREIEAPRGYECNSCERRFLCGLCPAQASMETGSPDRKSDYYCSLGREREQLIVQETARTNPGKEAIER